MPHSSMPECKSYLQIYNEINSLTLNREDCWIKWLNFLEAQPHLLATKDLKKLWIKLIKKYKYKFSEFRELKKPYNFHTYIFDPTGDGIQSLIRFYEERHLIDWRVHLFEFGLHQLFTKNQYTHLEIYFLTSIICHEWAAVYEHHPCFHSHFEASSLRSTKELYSAFTTYKQQLDNGEQLFNCLKKYNPHFKLNAKSTPLFFKELYKIMN